MDSNVERIALNYMKDSSRVGLSIGIFNNGREFVYNYGEAIKGSNKFPTKNTIYEIGSLTKTFTGLLVAHAIAEKKLNTNEDIRKYLPGNYPNLQYPDGGPIKLGYLIAHTAQFPNSVSKEIDSSFTREDFVNELHKVKLDTFRRFTYGYSNFGYQLLGYILESIYRKPYEELVKQFVTEPLKMPMSKINYTKAKNLYIAKGYDNKHNEMPNTQKLFPAAGSMRSNVVDMLKYMQYQLSEKDAIVKMTHRITYGSIDDEAVGFQWNIGKNWNWNYYIRGNGGTKGFTSFCVMYPDYNIGIILLSNQAGSEALRGLYETQNEIFNVLKASK